MDKSAVSLIEAETDFLVILIGEKGNMAYFDQRSGLYFPVDIHCRSIVHIEFSEQGTDSVRQ